MDSDFSTKDEYLAVKFNSQEKQGKDWYNISAQVYNDATTKAAGELEKVDGPGLDVSVKEKPKGRSSSTGRFRQRKRGMVCRQDAMRRKTKVEEVDKYKEDYLEWTKALEELDHVCAEHLDVDNAYAGYI